MSPLGSATKSAVVRRAVLASALLPAALGGAAFVDSVNQPARASTSDADEPGGLVVSLTCEAVDGLIDCTLVTTRGLAWDEGVQFVVTVGGDPQIITATSETQEDFRAGSSCGQDDGACYVFSFAPERSGGGEVQVSHIEAISADALPIDDPVQPTAQPELPQQAETPPGSDQPGEPAADADPEPDVVAKESWPETKEVLDNGIEIVDRPEGGNVVTISPNGQQISIQRTESDGDGDGDETTTTTDSEAPDWFEHEQPGETDPGEANIDESTDEESLVVLNYPTSSKGDPDHADNWESTESTYFELRERGEPFIVCDPARTIHTTRMNPFTGEMEETTIHITELCWTEYP